MLVTPSCSGFADLESRKRAPLYQKKQEEELRAAIEKAQECEIRAQDAEMKQKEAKVDLPVFAVTPHMAYMSCIAGLMLHLPLSDTHRHL